MSESASLHTIADLLAFVVARPHALLYRYVLQHSTFGSDKRDYLDRRSTTGYISRSDRTHYVPLSPELATALRASWPVDQHGHPRTTTLRKAVAMVLTPAQMKTLDQQLKAHAAARAAEMAANRKASARRQALAAVTELRQVLERYSAELADVLPGMLDSTLAHLAQQLQEAK